MRGPLFGWKERRDQVREGLEEEREVVGKRGSEGEEVVKKGLGACGGGGAKVGCS